MVNPRSAHLLLPVSRDGSRASLGIPLGSPGIADDDTACSWSGATTLINARPSSVFARIDLPEAHHGD